MLKLMAFDTGIAGCIHSSVSASTVGLDRLLLLMADDVSSGKAVLG
jgi:hypothetical protein